LAQALGQVGDETPDIQTRSDVYNLKSAFEAIQECLERGLITAYHNRSDGGLITAITEMCIAGNRGATLRYNRRDDLFAELFCEEAGMVFEFEPRLRSPITRVMHSHG